VTPRTRPARRFAMWDEFSQWLLLAKTWGIDAIEALDFQAYDVAYNRAKMAAHHANRALDLLEQLTQ
jgi:hypothetical protein